MSKHYLSIYSPLTDISGGGGEEGKVEHYLFLSHLRKCVLYDCTMCQSICPSGSSPIIISSWFQTHRAGTRDLKDIGMCIFYIEKEKKWCLVTRENWNIIIEGKITMHEIISSKYINPNNPHMQPGLKTACMHRQ